MAEVDGAALAKITAKEGEQFVKEFFAGGGLGAGALVDGGEKLRAQGLEVAAFDAHQVDEAGAAVHLRAGEESFQRIQETLFFDPGFVHRLGFIFKSFLVRKVFSSGGGFFLGGFWFARAFAALFWLVGEVVFVPVGIQPQVLEHLEVFFHRLIEGGKVVAHH